MAQYTQNALNIIASMQYKGIGKAWIVRNWRPNLTDSAIVNLINATLKNEKTDIYQFSKYQEFARRLLDSACLSATGVVGWMDSNYPYCRGTLKASDFPVILAYKGNLSLLQKGNDNVAVIGVLKPEMEIIEREQKFVSNLVDKNYTIVSGLAFGCDSIAHQQTLDLGGKTIAILPSTIANILPSQHTQLAEDIISKDGLLITEYLEEPNSQLEMKGRYVERDRLQAMFSDAVILTASYDVNTQGNDSGSRIAMECARKYEIPRYVMYREATDKSNPQFDLNRRILAEGDSLILTPTAIDKINNHPQKDLVLF